MESVEVIKEESLDDTAQTPGMTRLEAFDTEGIWVGQVTTAPGQTADWHHHGDNDTYGYVVSGVAVIDFGPEGKESLRAGPGDFVRVPSQLVHRERNPGEEESRIVLFRVGEGPPVFNVDGPE